MDGKRNVPYIELPIFQGPLDLLLHLIQQNKVDIYDIPIAVIADQFISTVKKMEALDMEITSEFLVLAAQLLYLKSRQLLPKPQKTDEELQLEEDMKQNLVERLVTYRAFKEVAAYLSSKEESSGSKYFREINLEEIMAKIKPPNPLTGISLADLLQAFKAVLQRVEKGEDLSLYVEAEDIPIELMITDIMRRMILNPKGMKFTQLLRYRSRVEIVVAFLALLELLKDGKLKAEQSSSDKEIFIVPTAKAWDFRNEETV
ncbi:MAG TPA: segregation/condensation protein A [Peptococcaceae bacterium]|nr:segregation/condensation protein A [Peptococcaceae bacterium]